MAGALKIAEKVDSTQRHPGKVVDQEESKLWHRLREIAADHLRWGCRMA
jgi:hypothetical protein